MPNLSSAPTEVLGDLPITDIRPSPHNPRRALHGIDDLAASIKEHGLLQRVLVRPRPESADVGFSVMDGQWIGVSHFEVVAGHRRFAALQKIGAAKVAVVVRSLSDTEVLCIQAVENDQRQDVTPLERAAHYQRMRDAGMSVEAIAAGVGQSKTVVRSVLLLNKATPEIAEAIQAGKLTAGVAEIVLRVKDEGERAKALRKVLPRDEDGEPVSLRRARAVLERAKLPKAQTAPTPAVGTDAGNGRVQKCGDLCPTCGGSGLVNVKVPKAPADAARKTKAKADPVAAAPAASSPATITRDTPLADLLHAKDAAAAGRALDAAGLDTVGALLDAVVPKVKPGHSITSAVYAHLRGVKGLGTGAVNEVGDALVDAGLIGGVGEDK